MAKYINSRALYSALRKISWRDSADEELVLDAIFEIESKNDMWIVPDRIKAGDNVVACPEYFDGDRLIKENRIYTVEAVDKSNLEMGDDDYLIKLSGIDGFWFSELFTKEADG